MGFVIVMGHYKTPGAAYASHRPIPSNPITGRWTISGLVPSSSITLTEARVGAVTPWGWGCEWHWGHPLCFLFYRVADSLKSPLRRWFFLTRPLLTWDFLTTPIEGSIDVVIVFYQFLARFPVPRHESFTIRSSNWTFFIYSFSTPVCPLLSPVVCWLMSQQIVYFPPVLVLRDIVHNV